MTRYVLINGPKRSGKSSCAAAVQNSRINASISVIGFSYHLKRFVHGIYLGRTGFGLDPDHFDAVKEQPQELLGGMSWRKAYIHYSERVMKPLHGPRWFGEQVVRAATEEASDIVIVPDSGFRDEVDVLIDSAGANNVLLIRLHREGYGFAGDSRGYVSLLDRGIETHDVQSREDALNQTMDQVVAIVGAWYRRSTK